MKNRQPVWWFSAAKYCRNMSEDDLTKTSKLLQMQAVCGFIQRQGAEVRPICAEQAEIRLFQREGNRTPAH